MEAVHGGCGISMMSDNLEIAAESDGLFGGTEAGHARRNPFTIEHSTFVFDLECGECDWCSYAFENAVFPEKSSAIPQSQSLAFGLDGDAEVERHDHHLVTGLEGAELEIAIEVHDAIERGLVLGGNAEVGIASSHFVSNEEGGVVKGEKVIRVHLAEHLLGARNGIG